MKIILIGLLLVLVTACASSNSAMQKEDEAYDLYIQKIQSLDSAKKIQNEVQKIEEIKIEEFVDELRRLPNDENNLQDNVENQILKIKKIERNGNLQVIDRTSSINSEDIQKGWIAYSVPNEMKVRKNYSVKVRISKKTSGQSKYTLILGDDDAINNPLYPSIAEIEDVRVAGEMSAELRADDSKFKIVSLSTPVQNIDNESYTEWEWTLTPLSSGSGSLKLIVKVKDLNKDIVVFNRNIKVKSNVPVVVEGFFDKYWQWLMTTIFIPIFLYFWNRKKEKQKKS